MYKMKIDLNDEPLDIFGYKNYSFLILIIFYFVHASMIIKVDNRVIDSLNIIYLNEYFILFIYLVCESGIIT